jgi:hypothetical protein
VLQDMRQIAVGQGEQFFLRLARHRINPILPRDCARTRSRNQ